MCIILSCILAVGTNMSQFLCIGRFTAVSFQVLGHMKTVLVLILGFTYFGREGLNSKVVVGMLFAITGMLWFSRVSTLPGGKERVAAPAASAFIGDADVEMGQAAAESETRN
eukprot:TRINITY_DN5397_c0_g1_i4.p2 TRINITY_DN5397_c0_g1~~TRINITY_DN5397_c0_g1_i4.p2  ORF type:complete len:112 (+),score=31.89 TRINITY_DN5397_c0_g1_i4:201-536(+)